MLRAGQAPSQANCWILVDRVWKAPFGGSFNLRNEKETVCKKEALQKYIDVTCYDKGDYCLTLLRQLGTSSAPSHSFKHRLHEPLDSRFSCQFKPLA
jgi:hypothetical protein